MNISRTKSGADHLVDILLLNKVEVVFCITGAGNLAIVDAIVRNGRIKLIYSHNEQAAVMEAQGYSRVSNKIGVALVTTGGGTSNSLTGVLSAFLDSIPILVISGNESSYHCINNNNLRAYGVQGFNSVEVFKTITKQSIRILNLEELKDITQSAITKSLTARMGPTHIDFPMDLQRSKITTNFIEKVKSEDLSSISDSQSKIDIFSENLVGSLNKSTKPVIYIGNGCRSAEGKKIVKNIIEKYQIPFFLSWSAIDLFPENHPLNMGRIGIYGDRAANIALQKSDLLICLGTRLAIPQVGYDLNDFGRNSTKWLVEIDESECQKFANTEWNILNCNVEIFLQTLNYSMTINNFPTQLFSDWIIDLENIWKNLPRINQTGIRNETDYQKVHSADVLDILNSKYNNDAVIVTDVGAGLLSGHYMFEATGEQRFFTSQGLGEMGFGLPAAIGAHFAAPDRQIVCLNTDGGIMFNLQELQLIPEHQIPLKLFIFNNNGYAMIKISQNNLFESRFAGSTSSTGISFPSFEGLAKLFKLSYYKIDSIDKLNNEFDGLFSNKHPILFEVVMDENQKYLPRLATNKREDGSLISPPIEDLDPLVDLSTLENLLGYSAHENSKKIRSR
jgi:acetolactate synthase-1/2/3 large subunit